MLEMLLFFIVVSLPSVLLKVSYIYSFVYISLQYDIYLEVKAQLEPAIVEKQIRIFYST